VRQSLLRADASKTNVTRILTDHCFWELGCFSVAYRALFGETPSQTLRRPAEQRRGGVPARYCCFGSIEDRRAPNNPVGSAPAICCGSD
jgi:Helix-turn-helix domain